MANGTTVGAVLYRALWRRTRDEVEAVPCTVLAVEPASSDGYFRHDGYVQYRDERGGDERAYVVHDENDPAVAVTSARGSRLFATPAAALHDALRAAVERRDMARRDLALFDDQVATIGRALSAARSEVTP